MYKLVAKSKTGETQSQAVQLLEEQVRHIFYNFIPITQSLLTKFRNWHSFEIEVMPPHMTFMVQHIGFLIKRFKNGQNWFLTSFL